MGWEWVIMGWDNNERGSWANKIAASYQFNLASHKSLATIYIFHDCISMYVCQVYQCTCT